MRNLFIIARFEITRLLLTRRGMLSVVAFALVWFLLLWYAIYPASRFMAQNNQQGSLTGILLQQINLGHLSDWAVPELTVYWLFSLFLLPFFSIMLTADQTASDRARGTLRFLHLRATRNALFFGRFLGQMLVQCLIIAITAITTFALALTRDPAIAGSGLEQLLLVIVNLLIVVMPYTALMAVMSIIAKSARQATLYAIILWIVSMLVISMLHAQLPGLAILDWILPGSQITPLMKLQGWDTLQLMPIPLIQTAVLLLAGWKISNRIDL